MRSLVATRWLSFGAILTVALGIGLNVGVFGVVDRFLFRPLPFHEPSQLVTIYPVSDTGQVYFTFPRALAVDARKRARTITDLAYAGLSRPYYSNDLGNLPLRLTDASFNTLSVLGIRPTVGRPFTPEDARSKRRLALLRDETWRQRFGGEFTLVGRSINHNRGPIEIVGILPAGFIIPSINWASPSDGLLLADDLLESAGPNEGVPALFGRLQAHASPPLVQAEFDVLIAGRPADRSDGRRTRVLVERMQKGIFWNTRIPLVILFIGGSMVWLVACVNLGTLMIARGQSMESQTAIQTALGASRHRLMQTTLLEVVIICGLGGIAAVGAFVWCTGVIVRLSPSHIQPLITSSLNVRVLGFSVLVTLVGVVLAGVYPAWRATRIQPQSVLRRSGITSRRSSKTAQGLLVIETALTTALVVAGSLTINSFWRLMETDLGFEPVGLHAVTVAAVKPSGESAALGTPERVLEILRSQPHVRAGAAVDIPVAGREVPRRVIDAEGRRFARRRVAGQYFDTTQMRSLSGRVFTQSELGSGASVAVLNASGARSLWPSEPFERVLGRFVRFQNESPFEVIGVVGDSRDRHTLEIQPEVFVPAGPQWSSAPTYMLRLTEGAALDQASLNSAMEREFGTKVRVTIASVAQQLEPWLQNPRLYAALFGTFAVVSLALAAIGLFAVATFDISQRQHEMGIRLALGATGHHIRRLILRHTLQPVILGLGLGYVIAYWAAALLQAMLHKISAREPIVYVFVGGLLLSAAVLAVWRPIKRAREIDPLRVLRHT
jgi:predicted permease